MAALDTTAAAPHAGPPTTDSAPPLARLMREFKDLVRHFEAGLLRSLPSDATAHSTTDLHNRACRLAIADISRRYTPSYIRRSLDVAESEGKRLEDQLNTLSLDTTPRPDSDSDDDVDADASGLASLHNGHFRLYSTELFNLLDQPADLRFGTLRFHRPRLDSDTAPNQPPWVNVELALNTSFYVADSMETLPYHTFRLPSAPSLQNRGILSRKPQDQGAFPPFDSWLLFTFLGNGCIKLEVPIEMCADIYGGPLTGRENHDVLFWGFFVDDQDEDNAPHVV